MTSSPHWTTALTHALHAASRGLAVFPTSRVKMPAVRGAHRGETNNGTRCRGECGRIGHGVHDGATDPARVREMFHAAPWATGYGISCGRPPFHLIGIDVDIKGGVDGFASLAALADRHDFAIPETIEVATPSGGRHLWLSAPAGVRIPNSAGRLAPGVDVRGTGGLLVGPGSHTARGVYAVIDDGVDRVLRPVPPPLLALLAPPVRSAPRGTGLPLSGRRAEGLVQFVLDSEPGGKAGAGRNSRLFWAACRAWEGDPAQAERLTEALVAAGVRTGLSEQEARATVASAGRSVGARR